MICFDLIPIIHNYSDIENRVMLQRIFKDSVKFTYKKLNSDFQITLTRIHYDQYHNFTKRTTFRQWIINIPIGNHGNCYVLGYYLDENMNQGSMINFKNDFKNLERTNLHFIKW